MRAVLAWSLLAAALGVPIAIAATSPYLAYREPVYVAAGFAGIAALGLLLVQPLLAVAAMPGLGPLRSRRLHAWTGALLVACVVVHVAGLYVTSPPDVIDALAFASPTPFSMWGVVAMWAVLAAAALAALRRGLPPRRWKRAHLALAAVTVGGTVAHAMLIEGTMGTVSKAVLCGLVVVATVRAALGLRRRPLRRRGSA